MLAKDVRFEGFTATDWGRFLSLWKPQRPAGAERDPARPRGGVIAVYEGPRLRKLMHTKVGRLRLDDAARDWPLSAAELAHRHAASYALAIEAGALERLMDRFGQRARRGDDLTTQVLTLIGLAQEEIGRGALELWPARLSGAPLPTATMVRTTLDAVCPVGRAMVVGLFQDGEVWTSIALHRGPTGFDRILGPDEIRDAMGLISGDWRRDYRHIARAVEQRTGPLALGCFAEVATFRRLEVDPMPGAWSRAIAVRDVILSPIPMPIAIPLGIDVGWAAVSAFKSIAERVDPFGIVGPTLESFRTAARGKEIDALFGFDPLELLRRLITRER